jgi:hypothetical protein
MKPRSCNNICCTEAAASTPHLSQTWPLASTVSGFDDSIHAILHPLVGVGTMGGDFECYIAEITDRRMMPMSRTLWNKRWESRRSR